MTDEELLRKSIEKAVKGGWKAPKQLDYFITGKKKVNIDWEIAVIMTDQYQAIIFSHSFAKAFWGKEMHRETTRHKSWVEIPAWRYHQHKMLDEVQEGKEPLKYIERFL